MKRHNLIIGSLKAFVCIFILVMTAFCLKQNIAAEDSMPDNGIPVVYIHIDESQGSIEDMLNSPDHSVYCYGKLSIEVPEGFHYTDYPDLDLKSYEGLDMSIRGRGNSTWNQQDKKPFKIKLDKKEDIFGFGKNKHWALLANAFDPSLIRNRITFWLSERMSFDFTPQGVPVDLVLTGEQYGTKYLGSYYLCENIRVDDNRLEIGELEEDMTDMPEISGGYLIQDAFQVDEGNPNRFNTIRGVSWANDTPSFDIYDDGYENPAQKNYIRNHLNTVEDAIYECTEEYRELLDIQSAASYWLINTLGMNLDAYKTSSTYIYKERDKDGVTGKVYWGPVWDFDYAWDQGLTYEGFNTGHAWMRPLFTDFDENGFMEELHDQWPALRENAEYIISDGGLIDQYYEETKLSAEKDHEINPPKQEEGEYSYKEKVENLKTWIRNRIDWLDANLDSIDQLVHKITYTVDGETVAKDYTEETNPAVLLPLEPEKEGYLFMGWEDQDGNPIDYQIISDHDLILTAKFIPESEAVQPSDIVFAKSYDAVQYDPNQIVYLMDWEVLPRDAYDKSVNWSVSDESIASITEDGEVHIHSPGVVIITATTLNGISRDFTLTISEDEIPLPQSIYAENDVIYLKPGETANIRMHTDPAVAKVDEYSYDSENYDVASVDFYGVIKAISEGTTRIQVNSSTWRNETSYTCEAWITVIVSNETEPVKYTVVSGSDAEWQKNSEKDITLTVKRSEADETCFAHFTGVQIDGVDLKKDTGYLAKAGSTIITIRPAGLRQLKAGTHTVTILFDDGKAETSITIKDVPSPSPSPAPRSPDTDDSNSADGWIALTAAALLIFAVSLRLRTKSYR